MARYISVLALWNHHRALTKKTRYKTILKLYSITGWSLSPRLPIKPLKVRALNYMVTDLSERLQQTNRTKSQRYIQEDRKHYGIQIRYVYM